MIISLGIHRISLEIVYSWVTVAAISNLIIISLTSIFFQDKSRVWTAASQQHYVDNQPLATFWDFPFIHSVASISRKSRLVTSCLSLGKLEQVHMNYDGYVWTEVHSSLQLDNLKLSFCEIERSFGRKCSGEWLKRIVGLFVGWVNDQNVLFACLLVGRLQHLVESIY